MRVPDLLVYVLALGVLLFTLLPDRDDAMAPEAPPLESVAGEGRPLPAASAFDERILVQVDRPTNGTGTAFAIDDEGHWLTARHVVDGCDNIALEVSPGTLVPIGEGGVITSPDSDMAILITGRAPSSLPLETSAREGELRVGTVGFHIGFPQGKPGEATSKLLSRSRLISRGERRGEEDVLAWAEQGRTRGIIGSLGGISGAPVLDEYGRVIGVTVAESPRRGRIYTTSPASVDAFLTSNNLLPDDTPEGRPVGLDTYGTEADRLRRSLAVVKVVCRVRE